MGSVQGVHHLDDPDSVRIQRRMWRIQRLSWACMVLVLLGAMGGVFGAGPLSRASASSSDGTLQVEYERLGRARAVMPLRVRLPAGGREIALRFGREYFDGAKLEQVIPQPRRVELAADRLTFFFDASASGGDRVEVVFQVRRDRPGRVEARVGHAGSELALVQFIFP